MGSVTVTWRPVTFIGRFLFATCMVISVWGLHFKSFSQVKLAADRVVDQEILGPLALDPPFGNEIGAIHYREGLADVVIGYEDAEPGVPQIGNDLLHVVDGDGIDPAERFVQHEEARPR